MSECCWISAENKIKRFRLDFAEVKIKRVKRGDTHCDSVQKFSWRHLNM